MLHRPSHAILAVIAVSVILSVVYLAGPFLKREVPVLMYHHIGVSGADIWTVSPLELEAQMRQLKEDGYETILPSDLVAYTHRRKRLPRKPVILTFDDGSRSVKDIALPILRRYEFKAIVYLVTDATSGSSAIRGEVDGVPCLTWPEVRQLHQEGTLAFGGHTVHHDRDLLRTNHTNEIEACYRDIVAKGGFMPDSFSYAYNEGAGDKQIERIVRKTGFTTAMTCTESRARIRRKTNLLQLPRLWVRGGQHMLSAARIAPEGSDGQTVFRVLHGGRPFPAAARFVWAGMPRDGGWLPVSDLASGPTLYSSPAALVPDGQQAVGFELWDKNRFFRLYALPAGR